MSRRGPPKLPKYRLHRPSGRGVIQFRPLYGPNPKYLDGAFNSEESRAHYQQCCQEILAYRLAQKTNTGNPTPGKYTTHVVHRDLYVAEAARDYLDWAKVYYGVGRTEFVNVRAAARVLAKVAGHVRLADFGPVWLEKVRGAMIAKGWARTSVNAKVSRVRRLFKWCVSRELCTAETWARLTALAPLTQGKTTAKESTPVQPVDWLDVETVLPHLSPAVATMVKLQWLTGMRSDELTAMRGEDLEQAADVWLYEPFRHKTKHRGKRKIVCIGPKGQEILRPWLRAAGYFFRPVDARRGRRVKTRERYTAASYQHALNHGFDQLVKLHLGLKRVPKKPKGTSARKWYAKHDVRYWHPHQLRHSRATVARESHGLEGSVAVTGNTVEAAQIYAEQNLRLAKLIARETG